MNHEPDRPLAMMTEVPVVSIGQNSQGSVQNRLQDWREISVQSLGVHAQRSFLPLYRCEVPGDGLV